MKVWSTTSGDTCCRASSQNDQDDQRGYEMKKTEMTPRKPSFEQAKPSFEKVTSLQRGLIGLMILSHLLVQIPHKALAQDFPPPPDFDNPAEPNFDAEEDPIPPPADDPNFGKLPLPRAGGVGAGNTNNNSKNSNGSGSSNKFESFGSKKNGRMNVGGSGSSKEEKSGNGLTKSAQQKFNKAGIEDITDENFPETIESFDFPNVEITDVIKAISELTGKNFIIDPGVRGKITIIAPSKLTVAEAYKAFLSALAINGFTVVPSGQFLKVKSARNAQRDSIETFAGAYYPNTDQMITRIIHLKHISAEAVNRDLRILPSKDGEMSVYPPTNSIILSDWGANIDRVMKIINQLDVPGFEEQLEVVPIKFAKAKDLADLVDKIVNKGQGGNKTAGGVQGGFAAGVPRFSRASSASSQQGASFFVAIPEERTNSIIIVGNKSGIARVRKLIAQLDFRVKLEDSGGVNVYYVKHGEAEKIAQVLSGVAKDAGPKNQPGQGQPGGFFPPLGGTDTSSNGSIFNGDVKVTADKNTNSLVITASKQDYEVVMDLLRKLDIPRDQVFVEAIIMEMTAGDGFAFKPSYYNFAGDGGIARQSFNGGTSATEIADVFGGAGAVLGFGGGKDVTIKVAGTDQKVPSLVGLINLLKRTTKANILSKPQVLALDNQEALIQVGDKVVTSAQTTSSNGVTSTSPQFEEALIELKIKPFINPTSETIRMEIDQSVKQPSSSAATPKAFADQTQPLSTRKIKTNLVVRNGDTAVLGGLIQDRDTETINKVPVLGDIPLLGWLFKSKETSKQKVNMLVFLTPQIIRNPSDNQKVLARKLDQRIDYIKQQGGVDPYGATVDEIQSRSANSANGNENKLRK